MKTGKKEAINHVGSLAALALFLTFCASIVISCIVTMLCIVFMYFAGHVLAWSGIASVFLIFELQAWIYLWLLTAARYIFEDFSQIKKKWNDV